MYNGITNTNIINNKFSVADAAGDNKVAATDPRIKGILIGNNGAKANLANGNSVSFVDTEPSPSMPYRKLTQTLFFDVQDMTLADDKTWTIIVTPRGYGVSDFSTVLTPTINLYTPDDKATADGSARINTPVENNADGKNKANVIVFEDKIAIQLNSNFTKDVVTAKGALVLAMDMH